MYIYIYLFLCFKVSKPLKEILPLSQFQSTVEIHWGLIIVGESVGSAVCFKNPWCQSLIFLGETLISCIVPGNHGLFSGQQKKKNPAHNAPPSPPSCTHISAECSTPASGTTPPHKHTHIKHGASHFPGTGAVSPPLQHCLCFFSPFLFPLYFLLEDECRWWKAAC